MCIRDRPDQPPGPGAHLPEHPPLPRADRPGQRARGVPGRRAAALPPVAHRRAAAPLRGEEPSGDRHGRAQQLRRLVARAAAHPWVPAGGGGDHPACRGAAPGDGPVPPPGRGGPQPSLRRAAAAGDCPGTGHPPQGPAAGRAGGGDEHPGEGRPDGAHPAAPRSVLAGDPGHRARHEAGDGHLRGHHRARPRGYHRLRRAGARAPGPEGDRGLSGRQLPGRARAAGPSGDAHLGDAHPVSTPATLGTREPRSQLLEVNDLHVSYGAITALRGVSLAVGQGEVVALIGANGAGKTSTLRAISGLLKPRSGRIRLAEQEIQGLKSNVLVPKGMAHAPEGRGIFLNLTVMENLELGAYLRRDAAEIRQDLDYVFGLFPRLRERMRQPGGTLSGGEQQMLSISRALMSRPKLLLLDEPSLGLAPQVVETIFRILREVNARGVSILLVEQNAHLALNLAHYGYVLETGEVVMRGQGKALLAAPEIRKAYLGE